MGGTRYRIEVGVPLRVRKAKNAGGRSNIICPPGKRCAQARISDMASSGCRYISRPSAVMKTPSVVSTWSIQLKSSADCAHG